jgi:hypothetical protein
MKFSTQTKTKSIKKNFELIQFISLLIPFVVNGSRSQLRKHFQLEELDPIRGSLQGQSIVDTTEVWRLLKELRENIKGWKIKI